MKEPFPRAIRGGSGARRPPRPALALRAGAWPGGFWPPSYRAASFVAAVLLAVCLLSPGAAKSAGVSPEGQAPVLTVEEARARLQYLSEELARVEEWVERNWEREFSARHPEFAPSGAKESAADRKNRELRVRMAVSDLKKALRAERKEALERERLAILAKEIEEDFPVRLGPYDPERGEYPLLLGFGWPAGLSIRLRVSERESRIFAVTFPRVLSAKFRVTEKGDVLLLSLYRGRITAEAAVSVAPPGPRLLWQASHESWVTSVVFAPDGSRIYSAGADGSVCAWDAETGNRVLCLKDIEMALSLAVLPDGGSFATGGADGFVRLRDAATGRTLWQAQAAGMVLSVAVNPDGRFVAAGDDGGFLRVLNAVTGHELLRADLGAPVRSVAFSPGGRMIAVGTEGRAVVLWDMAANRPAWRVEGDGAVYAVAAGGAPAAVAAAGAWKRIRVLNESDGMERWSQPAEGEVRTLHFDRAGRLLAAGGSNYAARVFLAETGESLWAAQVGSPVRSLSFGPGGRRLAVGSADFAVRLFEIDEGDRVIAAFCSFGRVFVERDRARAILR